MKKLLFALLLFPILLHAAPEDRWYKVEVIIFAYKSKAYRNSELWPVDYSLPRIEKSRELGSAPFTKLSARQLRLGGAANRIKNAPDLEYMLHFGWLQPGLPEEKSVAVHVYDGMLEGAYRPESARSYKLDGTLRLSLSRYLHLESDLIWRDPLSAEEVASQQAASQVADDAVPVGAVTGEEGAIAMETATPSEIPTSQTPVISEHVYRMQQSRRMRSNEIHYLDHPRFGVVALVTPYEIKSTDNQ